MAQAPNQTKRSSESPVSSKRDAGDSFQQLYFYLYSHIVAMSGNSADKIHKRKANLLTIMSFCLIGMLSISAAAFSKASPNVTVVVLILISLGLWAKAFFDALLNNLDEGYHVVPGVDEGFDFLPAYAANRAFGESAVPASDADVFFMEWQKNSGAVPAEQIIGGRFEPETREYFDLVNDFNESIRGNDSISSFNYEGWLASLSFMYLGQAKHLKEAKVLFHRMQNLFVACMVVFLVSLGFFATGFDPLKMAGDALSIFEQGLRDILIR